MQSATHAHHLAAALDAYFAWYYKTYPVNATFIGIHEHDHRLPDFSENGAGDALAEIAILRSRFRRLPVEVLTDAERLDRILVEGSLEVQEWEFGSRHFHLGNPCVYTGEAIFGVMGLLLRPFAPLKVRLEAAAERMVAIPAFLSQGQANVRRAPASWTARAIRECEGALAFFERGIAIYLHNEGVKSQEVQSAADTAASAFRNFQRYLSAELGANADDDCACGADALDRLLRRGHFLNTDSAMVLALGREHLAAAEARLRSDAASVGIEDWREGLSRLADLHPPAGLYYRRFTEVWEEARVAAEVHDLITWPSYPIRYMPQPSWARDAAPSLYFLPYRSPPPFDDLPEADYFVSPIEPDMAHEEQIRRLRATNESVIKLNHVIHHGGLGHHVQNWYAYNRSESRVGRIAAADCASRIAMFCGGTMAEGWACYATDLMEAIGFLTPLERLSHTHTRLRMAARAIADVQLHTGVWALDEAAAFYRDTVGMPADASRAEAVKNSMFPGTALMYLCGNELIHQLRREMQGRQRGFEVKCFHDEFLVYGSVPVALIAEEMRRKAAN